jgi:hypothetical protein
MRKRTSRVSKIIEAQRRADDLHELLLNMPLGDARWESTWAALNEAQTARNRLEDEAA